MKLQTVDGFIGFDLDGAEMSAGGTRLAPDVTEEEVALLARAMTYKFAVLGARMGGAKAGVRANPTDPVGRADVMARFCAEILPMVATRRFLTGPDIGTYEDDFAPLRELDPAPGAVSSTVDGLSFEDVVTGLGVAAAADAALGGRAGRRVVIEGFGKVGGGVAREVVRRGGLVVGVSTLAGAVSDPDGLDIEALWRARQGSGDRCVELIDLPTRPPAALFEIPAEVLVPGARPGVLDAARAGQIEVEAVIPASNVPYTAEGLKILQSRGISAHADFICNAGAVIAYRSPPDATPAQVLDAVEVRIKALIEQVSGHPDGPFAGACALAEQFLSTWRADGMPAGPPLA